MPLMAKISINVARFSKTASDIVMMNINGEEGDWGYVHTFSRVTLPPLLPGPSLDAMNRAMLGLVAASLKQAKEQCQPVINVRLHEWVKHQIILATTNSAYGPSNPWKDPAVESAFG